MVIYCWMAGWLERKGSEKEMEMKKTKKTKKN